MPLLGAPMKRKLAVVLAMLLAGFVRVPAHAADVFEQNRKLGRGVNVLGYDPIWRSKERARFQSRHFELLKQAGFSSVRINLYPFRRMGAAPDLLIDKSWFEVADWAVKAAREQGLMVILDLHEYGALGQDAAGNKEKLLAAWRQLSTHYQAEPSSVLFEVLNEPNRDLTPPLWNDYFRESLAIIRQSNPTRTVIVGPAFWNSKDHLKELSLPEDDTNLIVTIHYYSPMSFTHQGAAWVKDYQNKTGVEWLGTDKERDAVKQDFDKVSAWAAEHHRPIFLGEFGAYDKGPMDSRTRWTDCVAREAEHHGWSWAYWQFDSDFILYDIPADKWVEPIRQALVPGKAETQSPKSELRSKSQS
jgi:endoglucanase